MQQTTAPGCQRDRNRPAGIRARRSRASRTTARRFSAALALAGAVALAPGVSTVGAEGTQTPVGAPSVRIGQVTFGNTGSPDAPPLRDYFRLPGVIAGDVVTLSARTDVSASASQNVCLAADVDAFNWNSSGCNLSASQSFGRDGQRIRLVASRATNNVFLVVHASGTGGGYDFTVERIQHKVGLGAIASTTVTSVGATGTVSVQARRTDGRSPGNGHLLKLVVRVGGSNYYYAANVQGDRATFKLSLPSSAIGDTATLTASSPETAVFAPSSSVPTSLKVVK